MKYLSVGLIQALPKNLFICLSDSEGTGEVFGLVFRVSEMETPRRRFVRYNFSEVCERFIPLLFREAVDRIAV